MSGPLAQLGIFAFWIFYFGTLLAIVAWIVRRLVRKPRRSLWPGYAALLVWLVVTALTAVIAMLLSGGHNPRWMDDLMYVYIGTVVATFGAVLWLLYWKLRQNK